MKKISISLLAVLFTISAAHGQWLDNSNNYTTGNLGIGLNNTSTKQIWVRSTANDHIGILENTSPGGWGLIVNATNDPFRVGSMGNTDGNYFTVKTNGNVGVGTTTPDSKLEIYSNIPSQGAYDVQKWSTSNSDHNLKLQTVWDNSGISQRFIQKVSGTDYTSLAFYQGNVGIGTNTPGAKFEVNGSANDNGARFGCDLTSVTSPFPSQVTVQGLGTSSEARLGFATTMSNGQGAHTAMIKTITPSDGGGNLIFQTREASFNSLTERVRITNSGNVGIGTTAPDAKLAVKGIIHTQEVRVDMLGAMVPDYVFEKNYTLPTLTELEAFIKINKHLPEVPTACTMEENGVNLGEMNMLLLKKVEELTLYMIEQQKVILEQNNKIKQIEEKFNNK